MLIEEFVDKMISQLETFREDVDAEVESADEQKTEDEWFCDWTDYLNEQMDV